LKNQSFRSLVFPKIAKEYLKTHIIFKQLNDIFLFGSEMTKERIKKA